MMAKRSVTKCRRCRWSNGNYWCRNPTLFPEGEFTDKPGPGFEFNKDGACEHFAPLNALEWPGNISGTAFRRVQNAGVRDLPDLLTTHPRVFATAKYIGRATMAEIRHVVLLELDKIRENWQPWAPKDSRKQGASLHAPANDEDALRARAQFVEARIARVKAEVPKLLVRVRDILHILEELDKTKVPK